MLTKTKSKREYLVKELEKELKKASDGKMKRAERKDLAIRTIGRMNFDDSFQMHKSLKGYAKMLVITCGGKEEPKKISLKDLEHLAKMKKEVKTDKAVI